MDARSRRLAYIASIGLIGLVSIWRLVVTIRRDGVEDAALWIALLVVAVIVAVTLAVVVRRARTVAAQVRRARPTATVIPAFTTADTAVQARAAGASARGWMPVGGSPMALAVVDGTVEVWARGEGAPRWVVRRVPGGAAASRAVYGSREIDALTVSDGVSAVSVMPAYRPIRATGGMVGQDVDRAVTEVATAGR